MKKQKKYGGSIYENSFHSYELTFEAHNPIWQPPEQNLPKMQARVLL